MYQAVSTLPRRCAALLAQLSLLLLVAACDPSPTSVALRQGPQTSDMPPAPEQAIDAVIEVAEGNGEETAEPEPITAEVAPEPDDYETPASEEAEAEPEGSLRLLGSVVPPGEAVRLTWSASEVFEGVTTATPVLVVNGKKPGPTLCLTAAIHGDELNGIEMVRRILHELEPDELRGAVIGVPIVNLQGFRRGSRYLPDRRDLNRYFPGNPDGSSAARIAHSLFQEIISGCDSLVDLHTGSFYRTNLPQLRADLRYRTVREMTEGFGGMVVLHSEGAPGTLRRAATDAGIPAVTLEAGEPLRLQSSKVSEGVDGVFALLSAQDMIRRVQLLRPPEPVFYESTWVRADYGGILFSVVRLGQMVEEGDVLGTITDPITNEQNLVYAGSKGRVLGMALNQVVMPGFAAFRIGIETDGQPSPLLASREWGQTEMGEEESVVEEPAESDEGGRADDREAEESS